MSIKTTTLPTSKLLKDAGFVQDTEYRHVLLSKNMKKYELVRWEESENWLNWDEDDIAFNNGEIIAAPTTDELLEELPKVLNECRLMILGMESEWEVEYYNDSGKRFGYKCDESLPEALAQMWLYLKKEGLLNAKS